MNPMIQTTLVIFFLSLGAALILIAAFGIIRLPDIYMRMSASTKAATLGLGCILVGAAIHFQELVFSGRTLAIILFLLVTAPVAAHRIGRAAYKNEIPLWSGSIADELRHLYQPKVAEATSQGTKPSSHQSRRNRKKRRKANRT